jgi:NAD(P)-dependent dehydrogenase (short-subunit alcohol dehydrogenase family)
LIYSILYESRGKVDPLDSFRLDGKVAVVTGGAGLLGREFSSTLAAVGAKVVVADLNTDAAESVTAAIADEGLSAISCVVDVKDPVSVEKLIAISEESFQKIDILVNSAALDPKFDPSHQESTSNAFEDYPLELWEDALAVNLTGMFLASQAAARSMKKRGSGSIINLCSTYGIVGPDQRIYHREGKPRQYKPVCYSTTKAGVLGFTRYLAAYYAGTNIRVNALTPGGVYNDHEEDFERAYSSRTILGRMARKDEMNGALLFLASDASSYMTGANLVVDGGWTAW